MDNVTKLLIQGAAGAAGGATYVDDVFSTYLWDGNQTAGRSINNGIDFAGEGGAIWIKARSVGWSHRFWDTTRGATKFLYTSETHAEDTDVSGAANMLTSFDSNGVTLGQDSTYGGSNYSGTEYVSWSFRKAPKFFDIVTWSGNDTAGRQIPHNLGSVPGCIMVKKLSGAENWEVYHRAIDSSAPQNYRIRLNTNDTRLGTLWNNTAPTATHFTLSSANNVNGSGDTYIAYLFAHNDGDGEFGEDGDKDIIKCTTYTGTSSGGQYVNLGFQPQWLLVKATDNSSGGGQDWYIFDAMRHGLEVADGDLAYLKANDNGAEYGGVSEMYRVDATGFTVDPGGTNYMNSGGRHYIVVAIRCSDGVVGKPPTVGTDVFAMDYGNSLEPTFDSGFPVDFALLKRPAATSNFLAQSRLSGDNYLLTNSSQAEVSHPSFICWDSNVGWAKSWDNERFSWMWKRHAGFDVVAYKGNGTAGKIITHSMNTVPEMIWIKKRDGSVENWTVYHKGLNGGSSPEEWYLYLNSTNTEANHSFWNSYAPTSTQFKVSANDQVNKNNSNYIAMLFASVDGISKVGSYTGNDGTNSITTGFQPRFVIIKIAGPSGYNHDWAVLDTTRGWGSGNDNRLNLNTNASETSSSNTPYWTDMGSPTSTGFDLAGGGRQWNEQGRRYIYYAHA